MSSNINVRRIGEHDLPKPAQMTAGAAGFDLRAVEDTVLGVGQRKVIPTGFAWSIPDEFVGQIWPRSGIAVDHGIDTLAGLIDPDYTGEVKVVLINHGDKPFTIQAGDRIAQMILTLFVRSKPAEVLALDVTERGDSGFGSTKVA